MRYSLFVMGLAVLMCPAASADLVEMFPTVTGYGTLLDDTYTITQKGTRGGWRHL